MSWPITWRMPESRGQRLAGKTAIVTGIGSVLAKAALCCSREEGTHVVGCDIDEVAAARTVQLACEQGLD
ncbi:hypothetical protein [Pseudomonas putida]|uniref:hypothetical protein n=1 Tax=Pseudomonas putida TaxID=303 RepID=UPI00390589A0